MGAAGSLSGSVVVAAGGVAGTVSAVFITLPGAAGVPVTRVVAGAVAGATVTVVAARSAAPELACTREGSQPSIAATAVMLATMTAPAAHSTSG